MNASKNIQVNARLYKLQIKETNVVMIFVFLVLYQQLNQRGYSSYILHCSYYCAISTTFLQSVEVCLLS
jgi:hypothetical protein